MRKKRIRQGLAIALALFMTINYAGSYLGRSPVVSLANTATVSATSLNVRSGPGTGNQAVGKLTYGSSVDVVGQTTGSDGKVWYQIQYTKNGARTTGYVRSDYIKFPTTYQSDGNFEQYLNNQGFPESYKAGLRQLHAEHPNWVFTAQHTNLDWNDVINNESVVGRNLVQGSSPSSWKSMEAGAYNWETNTWPSFDSGSWVAASREIISYYMDPRNFLNEKYVFQFLRHKYNSSIHTIDGIQSMVQGTFLSGGAAVGGGSSQPSAVGPGGSSGAGSSAPAVNGGPGAAGSGSGGTGSSSGPGGAGGSSDYQGSQGLTVQPGVSPGSTGSGSGGSSRPPQTSGTGHSGTTNSAGPGSGSTGTGGAAPGTSGGVGTTAPGTTGNSGSVQPGVRPGSTGSGNTGVSTQAPGHSGNSNVSLQAPGASISRNRAVRVGTAIGPGMTSGPGGGTSSYTSGGTYSVPSASYAEIIMNAAARSGVNPYVLTAMILQEQGTQGSRGISGTVAGYEGYYNFFNIEAYQSGSMSAIERGLWFASQSGSYERPWNSVDKAIIGGAAYYGANYVDAGQDTFYLKKFNVQGNNLYKHQYMTNVQAAASEGAKLEEAYSSQLKQLALEFKIPVYKNMPDTPCQQPTSDGNPNNKLSALSVDGFSLTPTFSRDVTSYNLIVDASVTSVTVRASALDSSAVISGTGNIQLQSGNTDITVQVKAQNGTTSRYVIHVARQNGGQTQGGGPGTSGPGGTGAAPPSNSGSGVSIQIITEGPGQSSSTGGSGHTGPGGSNVTIVP